MKKNLIGLLSGCAIVLALVSCKKQSIAPVETVAANKEATTEQVVNPSELAGFWRVDASRATAANNWTFFLNANYNVGPEFFPGTPISFYDFLFFRLPAPSSSNVAELFYAGYKRKKRVTTSFKLVGENFTIKSAASNADNDPSNAFLKIISVNNISDVQGTLILEDIRTKKQWRFYKLDRPNINNM